MRRKELYNKVSHIVASLSCFIWDFASPFVISADSRKTKPLFSTKRPKKTMADTKIQRLRLLMEDEPVGSPESQELSTKVLHVPTLTLKDDTTKEIPPSTPDWGTYPAKASPKKKSFPRPRKNRDTSMKEDTQTNPSPVLPTSSSTSVPSVNGLNFGHMSSPNQTFCPVSAVSKFPYKYMRKNDSEQVSQEYFAGGRFWARTWNL